MENLVRKIVLLIAASVLLSGCTTGQVLFEVPDNPKANAKYLFYMHGIKLEDLGPDHKRAKNYDAILEILASHGFQVISEHREPVVIESYAGVIADQVKALLNRGVSAKNIIVSGYSKGSLITQAVSGILQNPEIHYVLISGCTDLYEIDHSKMQGRILSIYDKEDERFYACEKRIKRATDRGVIFKEIALNSGRGHRVFRLPKIQYTELWIDPLVEWVK